MCRYVYCSEHLYEITTQYACRIDTCIYISYVSCRYVYTRIEQIRVYVCICVCVYMCICVDTRIVHLQLYKITTNTRIVYIRVYTYHTHPVDTCIHVQCRYVYVYVCICVYVQVLQQNTRVCICVYACICADTCIVTWICMCKKGMDIRDYEWISGKMNDKGN